MTEDTMDLTALLAKSGDADFLRETIGYAAKRLMELEVGAQTGAPFGEKSTDRLAQRNGYRERDWETRAGTVELRIPRLRTGSYFPSFLEPRRMVEKDRAERAASSVAVQPRRPRAPRIWPALGRSARVTASPPWSGRDCGAV